MLKARTQTRSPSQSRRNILWIGSTVSGFNTYQTSLLEMLNHLEKRGNSVTLLGVRPSRSLSLKNDRVRTIFVPLKYKPALSLILFSLITSVFLPFYIAYYNPDFIFFQPDISVLGSIPALLLSKARRTKFVLDIRSIPVENFGLRGSLQKLGFNASANLAKRLFDGITIITPNMKNEVCQAFKIDPSDVGVWTSGVSTILFDPKIYTSESRSLRDRLSLTRKFVVFYHGAFSPTRGILETARAMKGLDSKKPEIVLFLLGAGPISRQIEELVKSEGLENNVTIHSPVSYVDVPKYIAMADVCISPLPFHPYWRFQCPLKLLEYMAMEKTIILTGIPAHREMIGKERCGVYISSAHPSEIADAILFAFQNKNKLDEWGKTGRKIVTERYTWERVSEDLENYLQVIERDSR